MFRGMREIARVSPIEMTRLAPYENETAWPRKLEIADDFRIHWGRLSLHDPALAIWRMAMTSELRSCSLCGGRNHKRNLSLRTRDLAGVYAHVFGVDVTAELPDSLNIELIRCLDCDLYRFEPARPGGAEFYARLAASPKMTFAYYPENRAGFAVAVEVAAKGSRLLDVGCGGGKLAARLRPGVDYTGLELNPDGLAAGRRLGLRLLDESVEDHARRNPRAYDVVCAFEVMEHVVDPIGFAEACRAALAPGGMMILSTPSADSFYPFVVNEPLNFPPHHLTWWTERTYRRLGERLGFAEVAVTRPRFGETGHGVFYLEHLALRGLMRRQGIPTHTPIIDDPAVHALRDEARRMAEILAAGLEFDLQAPNAATLVGRFSGAADRPIAS